MNMNVGDVSKDISSNNLYNEAPSFDALSQSMSKMGLGELRNETKDLFVSPTMQVGTVQDLVEISPQFQDMFNRAIGLAILGEIRRFARRIKAAYRGQ